MVTDFQGLERCNCYFGYCANIVVGFTSERDLWIHSLPFLFYEAIILMYGKCFYSWNYSIYYRYRLDITTIPWEMLSMQDLAGGDNNRTPAKEQSSTNQVSTVYFPDPIDIELNNPGVYRNTMATQMLNADAKMVTIQDLLGHARIATTERYSKVSNITVQRDYHKTMSIIATGGSEDTTTDGYKKFFTKEKREMVSRNTLENVHDVPQYRRERGIKIKDCISLQ